MTKERLIKAIELLNEYPITEREKALLWVDNREELEGLELTNRELFKYINEKYELNLDPYDIDEATHRYKKNQKLNRYHKIDNIYYNLYRN